MVEQDHFVWLEKLPRLLAFVARVRAVIPQSCALRPMPT
jgi:hypothetical protein